MKPRPFDYVQPDTVDEVLALLAEYGDDARILAGGQSLIADAQSAADRAGGADRHLADRRAWRHQGSRRHHRDRRRGDTEQVDGLAASLRKSCRWLRRRCRSSAIFRPATGGRSVARSRTPIRARKFRWRSRCSAVRSGVAFQTRRTRAGRGGISAGHADHGARARRIDRGGAVSGDGGRASGFAKWRAATATLP